MYLGAVSGRAESILRSADASALSNCVQPYLVKHTMCVFCPNLQLHGYIYILCTSETAPVYNFDYDHAKSTHRERDSSLFCEADVRTGREIIQQSL